MSAVIYCYEVHARADHFALKTVNKESVTYAVAVTVKAMKGN